MESLAVCYRRQAGMSRKGLRNPLYNLREYARIHRSKGLTAAVYRASVVQASLIALRTVWDDEFLLAGI